MVTKKALKSTNKILPTCLALLLISSVTYFLVVSVACFFLVSVAFSPWYNTALLFICDTAHIFMMH